LAAVAAVNGVLPGTARRHPERCNAHLFRFKADEALIGARPDNPASSAYRGAL